MTPNRKVLKMAKPHLKTRAAERRQKDRRRTWLVPGWKSCYRWLSLHVAALVMALAGAYEYLPGLKAYVPQAWFNHIMLIAGIAFVITRLKAQK